MSAQIAKLSASDLSKSLSKDHLSVNVEKADLPIENLRISAESPSNSLNNGSDASTPRSNPSPNNRVGQPKFASDHRSIFDRLTDPSKYTGTHKLRFDASGKGRGIEGRKDPTLTDLSQITRENLRKSLPAGANLASAVAAASNSPSSRRASVTIPKFGTQASKAKFIQIFTNGDVMGSGQRMLIGKNINSWDKFLLECSKTLKLPTGPCKKVYHVTKGEEGNYHKRITKVEDLEDGEIYLGCGAEEISQDKYPKALDQ